MIKCEECKKTFSRQFTLKRHYENVHGKNKKRNENENLYICDKCQKRFQNRYSFIKHWSTNHQSSSSKSKAKVDQKCPECKLVINFSHLSDHLFHQHAIKIEEKCYNFADEKSFLNWKKQIEKNSFSRFNLRVTRKNRTIRKYVCHRSGVFLSKSKGMRHIKINGSKKIDGVCPASMRYTKREDGRICVEFVKTHVGHGHDPENELPHLSISPSKKKEIAKKLLENVPKRDILRSVRESCDGNITREHLLTVQDIDNIATKHNIRAEYKKDQHDPTSTHIVRNTLWKENNSFVRFYKPQDSLNDKYPFLNKDDFVLILMNAAQGEILQKYGTNIISMDSTHGVGCNFELFSIVVMDHLHQGFPCAVMISNRKDTQVLELFFSIISAAVGKILAKVFMSDMAAELYNAWENVMGPVQYRLFCSWHVDKAWSKHLKKIKPEEKRSNLGKLMKAIMHETDENKFQILLEDTVKSFEEDEDCADFITYFTNNYVEIQDTWAYCYWNNTGINTNMSIERMHRTIKYLYFKGEKLGRLDLGIHYLVQFLKDKLFDRMTVLIKGKVSGKLRILRKRHTLWQTVQVTLPDKEDLNTFLITSDSNMMYTVQKNVDSCECQLICTFCRACIHKYVCSCFDNCIHFNMCKHIHAVCMFVKNLKPSNDACSSNEAANPTDGHVNDIIDGITTGLKKEKNFIIQEIKNRKNMCSDEELKCQFRKLLKKVENSEAGRVFLSKVLHDAEGKIDFITQPFKLPVKKHPVQRNKQIVKQLRLLSTKKKNTTKEKNFTKRMS